VVGNAYKTEGGTSWASSSDLRLKTVLGDYEKGLNEITALQPVRFRYLENNPRELSSDIEQVGFVAQEVQKIFPEAVSEAEDGYLDFNIHSINVAL
jgi:trimeric autotransporter adhesin